MYRRVALLLLALLTYTSPEYAHPGTPLDKILSIYHHSDQLLRLPNPTPASDSTALAGFETVIRLLLALPDLDRKDTLFCYSWLKKGILFDAAADYSRAEDAYRQVLRFNRKDDSLTFVTHVYAGTGYYYLSNFDSANYFLQRAESMAPRYKNREDEVRLYNILGVLYCDNGNYQQGQNYFKQALRLVEGHRPVDMVWVVNLQTNIATALYKMGLYQEALVLYKKILGYGLSVNYIYLNMGRTYTALDQYPEALACFRRVDVAKIPAVLNEMGYTQEQLGRTDSSAWFLDKFRIVEKNTAKINPHNMGINHLYRAGLLTTQKQYRAALDCLQQSILIFSRGFSNTDIFSNPTNFTGSFAYYRLFDALFKKAQVFGLLFKTDPRETWLQGSWQAYSAALSLLRYIEKSYDTDDAKLFLKKQSAGVYDGALTACLQLNNLHPDSTYLEQAFLISEKSKATIIFANLRENAFTGLTAADKQALTKMRNIRYNIARLNAQTEATTDSGTIDSIAREKSGYEITLARLQKQLERNNAFYKLKYDDSGPGIKELQKQLGSEQALISFYVAAGKLHTFVLTNRSIFHTSDDSVARLQQDVESWVSALKVTDNGRKFKAGSVGDRLYQRLVKPIQDITPSKDEWIIVPDGFLYYLPFESLPGGAGVNYLLQNTMISYRLSSRMLSLPGDKTTEKTSSGILSFAPFATVSSANFARLPASGDEIAGLAGVHYIDSAATKDNFLKAVNHQSIVHLATHAIASLNNAAGSFIAFYPSKGLPEENNLYLEELYGLNLSATQLVIISACETGQGELAGKEGVISLSRAFAYAGCASTINSLWKADDNATAYILKRFYVHLEKGVSKAKALQQAKLDYLSGDMINKSPAFWSQLVLMGDTAPLYVHKARFKWVLSLGALGVVTGIALGWKKRKRKKAGDFEKV